ncbi:hypothetical protein [Limnoglobus roseus]|uniref:Uncharacterized protein n=1 Tax=Limnoglobus roseus TaxID=2598579 RepID=A0A5C1AP69_9BACT|nr:hypothetical protein [Limnoglobus roseus]QEL19014.1 hypothetical protein PX52LOC_06065 [Limnoglobus roseus]
MSATANTAGNKPAVIPPLGTLHIVQSRGVKSYTLAIVREPNGRPVVVFTRKAPSADTHRVTLADTWKAGVCTFAGHHFAHHCAHVDAVLSMLAAGVLPDPAEWLAERERATLMATLAGATKSLTAAGLTVGPLTPITV